MEKIIFADKTELTIMEGAGLDSITAAASDWAGLGDIADALMKDGNLDKVQFSSDEEVTGEYENMKMEQPLFRMVDIDSDGNIHAVFAIRRKTEMELAIEELKRKQEKTEAEQMVQDGAIMELAGMIGGE